MTDIELQTLRIHLIILFMISVRNALVQNTNNVVNKLVYFFELMIIIVFILCTWKSSIEQIKKSLYGILIVFHIIDFLLLFNEDFNRMNGVFVIQTLYVSMFIEYTESRINTGMMMTSLFIYNVFNILHVFIKNNIDLEIFIMYTTIIIYFISFIVHNYSNTIINTETQ